MSIISIFLNKTVTNFVFTKFFSMASSSEDDIAASPPVENIMPPQPIMLLPKPPSRVYKTALDVINETIVKTLDSPHPGNNEKKISGKNVMGFVMFN